MPSLLARLRGASADLGAGVDDLREVRRASSASFGCRPLHSQGRGLVCDGLSLRGPKEGPEQRIWRQVLVRVGLEVQHQLGWWLVVVLQRERFLRDVHLVEGRFEVERLFKVEGRFEVEGLFKVVDRNLAA